MSDFEEYEVERVTTLDGHGTRMIQMYTNFTDSLPIYFEEKLTFRCHDFPTTWLLQVTFERDPNNDDVSCEARIKIIDGIGVSMDADLLVKLVPPFEKGLPFPRIVQQNGMCGDAEIRETFSPFVPREVLMQWLGLSVQLEIFFLVRGCHEVEGMVYFSGKYIPPIAEKEMSLAKL